MTVLVQQNCPSPCMQYGWPASTLALRDFPTVNILRYTVTNNVASIHTFMSLLSPNERYCARELIVIPCTVISLQCTVRYTVVIRTISLVFATSQYRQRNTWGTPGIYFCMVEGNTVTSNSSGFVKLSSLIEGHIYLYMWPEKTTESKYSDIHRTIHGN